MTSKTQPLADHDVAATQRPGRHHLHQPRGHFTGERAGAQEQRRATGHEIEAVDAQGRHDRRHQHGGLRYRFRSRPGRLFPRNLLNQEAEPEAKERHVQQTEQDNGQENAPTRSFADRQLRDEDDGMAHGVASSASPAAPSAPRKTSSRECCSGIKANSCRPCATTAAATAGATSGPDVTIRSSRSSRRSTVPQARRAATSCSQWRGLP